LAAASGTHGSWPWIVADIDGGNVATVQAALIGVLGAVTAAIIAAVVAFKAFKTQQREGQRQERARFFADAVRTVEDYAECPYRIRRRDGSAAARREITQHISDVKSRISFYTGWMAINGSQEVHIAYDAFVKSAQIEAGQQMTAAWRDRPTKRDRDVPIGSPLPRTSTDATREKLLEAMKRDLARKRR